MSFIKKTATNNEKKLCTLTEEELLTLHEILLEMYKDINAICGAHEIMVIAAGGTALGAVRHKGFIPWDDDMDLFMLRGDFLRFQQIFDEASPYPKGVYIDLNILKFAPEKQACFLLKGICSDLLRWISYSVYWNQYKSDTLKMFMSYSKYKANKYMYPIRMIIGKIFSFFTDEEWFSIFDHFVQSKETTRYTVPTGRKKYRGEVLNKEDIFPIREIAFEETYIYIFNHYDKYLANLYGDYMTIPKVEDREGDHIQNFRNN